MTHGGGNVEINFEGRRYDLSDADAALDLARDVSLYDYALDALDPGIVADLAAKTDCTIDDLMVAILSQAQGAPGLLTLPTDSAWCVEMRYDTTMWNEGFEIARQPRAIVFFATRAEADTPADEIGAGRFDPSGVSYCGFNGSVVEAHAGHPVFTVAQARTLFGAVRQWDGI